LATSSLGGTYLSFRSTGMNSRPLEGLVVIRRAFALSEEPPLRANQELLATGLSNVGGALLGSMPAGGGTTQTAVNRLAGAQTQLAVLVTAGAALMTMLLLAPLIGLMPEATLAALVIVYSIGLITPAEFRAILEVRRMEFIWALAAFAGVVALGTLKGILVAMVVSLASIAYQTANPPVYVLGRKPGSNVFRPLSDQNSEDETFPGLLLMRVEGRIFIGNAERIADQMRPLIADANPRVVALDLSRAPDLEYTALKMLTEGEEATRPRCYSMVGGAQPGGPGHGPAVIAGQGPGAGQDGLQYRTDRRPVPGILCQRKSKLTAHQTRGRLTRDFLSGRTGHHTRFRKSTNRL
jgi:sulfate permease, SulP family